MPHQLMPSTVRYPAHERLNEGLLQGRGPGNSQQNKKPPGTKNASPQPQPLLSQIAASVSETATRL